MVFRNLYYFSRARLCCRATGIVPFLADRYQSLGLVKSVRKRHRHRQNMIYRERGLASPF